MPKARCCVGVSWVNVWVERQGKFFHFVPLHAVVDYVNENFIHWSYSVVGEERSLHDTFSHFTRHKTIMLMIHTNTRIDRRKLCKGKNNLDKLTQIYARRIKLNFIKCDYIKTFSCASIDIGTKNFFMHLFFMLVCLTFLYRRWTKTWYFFRHGTGQKGHELTSSWIIKITDQLSDAAGNQRLIADRLYGQKTSKHTSRTVKSPRLKWKNNIHDEKQIEMILLLFFLLTKYLSHRKASLIYFFSSSHLSATVRFSTFPIFLLFLLLHLLLDGSKKKKA